MLVNQKPQLPTRRGARPARPGPISIDDRLLASSVRTPAHQPAQPMVRCLSVPLSPAMPALPLKGVPLVSRLEPHHVAAAPAIDPTLAAVLVSLAHAKPEGAAKVALRRERSQDVVVRLFLDSGSGLICPTWVLAPHDGGAPEDLPGARFCMAVDKALAPLLGFYRAKPLPQRMASIVRALTGRNLGTLALDPEAQAWEKLVTCLYLKRPIFACGACDVMTRAPVAIVDAFERENERWLTVYMPPRGELGDRREEWRWAEFLAGGALYRMV